ncbi:MAG: hypothetical protein RR400_00150 [Clostridia bacterium]
MDELLNRTYFETEQNKQNIARLKTNQRAANEGQLLANDKINKIENKIDSLPRIYNSYDKFYINPIFTCGQYAEPPAIQFVSSPNTRLKLIIKYKLITTRTGDKTVEIFLNNELFYSKIFTNFSSGENENSLEIETITGVAANNLRFVVTNANATNQAGDETRFKDVEIEIQGMNIMFLTNSYDFYVFSSFDKFAIVYSKSDSPSAFIGVQPADATLSFETPYAMPRISNLRNLNMMFPFLESRQDVTTINGVTTLSDMFNDRPGFILNGMIRTNHAFNWFFVDMINNTTIQRCTTVDVKMVGIGSPSYASVNPDVAQIRIGHDGTVSYYEKLKQIANLAVPKNKYVTATGIVRLRSHYKNHQYGGILTTDMAENILFLMSDNLPLYTINLGLGSRAKAYMLENTDLVVFLTVFNNLKKITLRINTKTNLYEEILKEDISGVQEFFLGPNNSHFTRKDKTIFYYHTSDETTPTNTFLLR